jgi:hypothetical protein
MDLGDLFVYGGPAPPRGRSRREELVAAVVTIGLPAIDFCLVAFAGLVHHPTTAMLWLPLGLAAVGAAICGRARVGAGRTFVMVLACLWWCLVASTAVVVMEIFLLPW